MILITAVAPCRCRLVFCILLSKLINTKHTNNELITNVVELIAILRF